MARKKKQLPIYEEVEIQDVAAEGKALELMIWWFLFHLLFLGTSWI